MTARLGRLAGIGVALTACTGSVAACGAWGPGPDSPAVSTHSSAAPANDPRDLLRAGVPGPSARAYHFIVSGGAQPMTGVVDAAKRSVRVDVSQHSEKPTFTLTISFLIIDQRTWTKVRLSPALPGVPRLPKKWMLLDQSRIKDKAGAPLGYSEDESDPGYVAELLDNATHVQQDGERRFAGVTDLGRTGSGDVLDEVTLKTLGGRAKAVPFTAVLDPKGRLTSLILRIPGSGKVKPQTYAVTYDGYDSTGTPTAPAAADQQQAVPAVYDLLNG